MMIGLKDIKIKPKLIGLFLLIGLIPLLCVGGWSLYQAKKSLMEKSYSQLTAVREIKKAQIEKFFQERRDDMDILVRALEKFKEAAFDKPESVKELGKAEDFFAAYTEKYECYDMFLIHPEGEIFYTVRHEKDYGTNILNGKYADTGLGRLVRKVLKSGQFGIEDFSPYPPSNNAPCAFIAQPLFHQGKVRLIVALQLSLKAINKVMQQREGMGMTEETYLVGPDRLMRSDSYLDKEGRSVNASFAGTAEKNGVVTEASGQALAGITGAKIIKDYNGNPVLSAYTSVNIGDFVWALLAEIDEDEVMSPVYRLMRSIGAASMGMTLFIIITAFSVGKNISDPLIKGVAFAKTVSEGNLRADLNVVRKDEAGILADALKDMTAKLRSMMNTIKDMANNVSSSSEELSSVSNQLASTAEEMNAQTGTVAAASEQISASVAIVSSAAKESGESVFDISAMTEEMASSVRGVSESVQKTAAHAKNAARISTEVSRRIDAMASAIEEMTASFNEVAKNMSRASMISENACARTRDVNMKIERLVSASREIGKIIRVIKDIADHTDMLALNATIEAAGAGRHGKGFAVLANEIKELARQSASAAGNISDLVEEIQNSTDATVSSVREISDINNEIAGINEMIAAAAEEQTATAVEISKNVTDNARAVRNIAEAAAESVVLLDNMEMSMDSVSKTATEVAGHIGKLSAGVNDVAMSVSEAANGVRDISKNIAVIGMATRETAASSVQTNASSAELAKMATCLKEIVSRFKL